MNVPEIVDFDEIAFIDVPDGPLADVDGGIEAAFLFLYDESMHTAVPDVRDPRRANFGGGHRRRSQWNLLKKEPLRW